jgi:hypothetical protein
MTGITITEYILPDTNRQYVANSSCEFSAFKWWYSGSTGFYSPPTTGNIFTTTTPPITGDKVWVSVTKYINTYWNGGEFYGGDFSGNFGGGTFHYGQLNNCFYLKQEIKPKPFIEDINKPTGPQSVKPVNTSRLV